MTMSTTSTPSIAWNESRIPLWLKLAYTVFMAMLIPVYLYYYGPTNFLYFCDVALIITLVGIWIESPLLISMCAVGIIASQTLWVIDFFSSLFGHPLTGLTDYMFAADHSLFLRGLSLFHGWLPFLLAYLVWRVGYDRRALASWTVLAWALRNARSGGVASRWISMKARSPPRIARPSRASPPTRLCANDPTPAMAAAPSAMQAMNTPKPRTPPRSSRSASRSAGQPGGASAAGLRLTMRAPALA